MIPVKLQQGTYQLEEIKAPKGYVVAKEPQQFKVDGETASITLEQKDMPQKGKITIKKIGEYKHNDNWADIREKVMGGIDFDIIAFGGYHYAGWNRSGGKGSGRRILCEQILMGMSAANQLCSRRPC